MILKRAMRPKSMICGSLARTGLSLEPLREGSPPTLPTRVTVLMHLSGSPWCLPTSSSPSLASLEVRCTTNTTNNTCSPTTPAPGAPQPLARVVGALEPPHPTHLDRSAGWKLVYFPDLDLFLSCATFISRACFLATPTATPGTLTTPDIHIICN